MPTPHHQDDEPRHMAWNMVWPAGFGLNSCINLRPPLSGGKVGATGSLSASHSQPCPGGEQVSSVHPAPRGDSPCPSSAPQSGRTACCAGRSRPRCRPRTRSCAGWAWPEGQGRGGRVSWGGGLESRTADQGGAQEAQGMGVVMRGVRERSPTVAECARSSCGRCSKTAQGSPACSDRAIGALWG